MSKIPAAEEFLKQYQNNTEHYADQDYLEYSLIIALQEFAKLHVQAAIEMCIEEAPSGSSTDTVSYEDVVKALKDCYPLTNIK